MSTRDYRKTGPNTAVNYGWCGTAMVGWCLVILATLYAIAVVAQYWWEILAGIVLVLLLAVVGFFAAARYAYQHETWRMGSVEYRCTKWGHLLSADRKTCPIDGSSVTVANFRRQRAAAAPKTRGGTGVRGAARGLASGRRSRC